MADRFDVAKKERIAAAAQILEREPEGEILADFCRLLFEHGAGEDIVGYEPAALAAICRDAFAFSVSSRMRGT